MSKNNIIQCTKEGLLLCPICSGELKATVEEYYIEVPIVFDPDESTYETTGMEEGLLQESEIKQLYCIKDDCTWWVDAGAARIMHPSGDIV